VPEPTSLSQWRDGLRRDLRANRGLPKSLLIVVALRVTQLARSRPGIAGRLLYLPVAVAYKLVTEWFLGVEIPAATKVGPGLRIRHGIGIVINPSVEIGADVLLRHGVTLGNRREKDDCPVIGDRVELGAGAVVIGAVHIGEGAKIGAGAVVMRDVPAGGVAYVETTVREVGTSDTTPLGEDR
jgi:putative colanic acid biosynthesis acetyltransferase WcaB